MSRLESEICKPIEVGTGPLDIDALSDVVLHDAKVLLSDEAAWLRRMAECEARLAKAVADGTPIMTGVAILVVDQCRRILAAAMRATAMAVHAMAGHEHHLHPVLFEAKPLAGQAAVVARLLVAAQACELRGGLSGRPAVDDTVKAIRALSPALVDDRPLDGDIESVYQSLVAGDLGRMPAAGG